MHWFRLNIICVLLLSLIVTPVHAEGDLVIRNTLSRAQTGFTLQEGFVSLYQLAKALHTDYRYDYITKKVIIENRDRLVQIMPDNPFFHVDSDIHHFTDPPRLISGQIMVHQNSVPGLLDFLNIRGYEVQIPEPSIFPDDPIIEPLPDPEPVPALAEHQRTLPANEQLFRNSEERPAKPSAVTGKNKICFVVLDPGHGGEDPGGIGLTGLREKIIVLKVGMYIRDILKKELPGVRIIMTRDENVFIKLNKRTQMANYALKKYKHGMFVSIHANISRNKKTYGYETFYLSDNPTDDEARAVAAIENGIINTEQNSPDTVGRILSGMLDTELIRQSQEFARLVNQGYDRNIGSVSKNRGIKTARFFVLEGAMMPSILTEFGFLSNKEEEQRMRNDEYLKKIARSIAWGIINFANYYNTNNGFTS